MTQEAKEKLSEKSDKLSEKSEKLSEKSEILSEILSQMALLTAACEGNMYHDHTTTNEAIYNSAVEIQVALMDLTE